VSLNNGNIFIIEKMGIFIYNEQLTNIIHEYPFTEENEKIDTLDKLSNIIIKKTDNYIICLINLRIYFFNEEGDFLLKGNETITNDECYHLALTPIPINDDKNFYYTIGFYTYSIQNEVYIFHLIYNKIDLIENKNDYVAAFLNKTLKELNWKVYKDAEVEFLSKTSVIPQVSSVE
jgi:hypothetical protein